jgi:probable selenium-dependent hydroxylase accessory protein YqeC
MISLESFKIGKGDVVSIVGSGGKTTLMYKLAWEAVRLGMKVISTTTTHIFVPTPDQTGKFIILDNLSSILDLSDLAQDRLRSSVLNHITIAQNYAEENKVKGIQPELVCKIHAHHLADLILVEADGSRQKLFKAPKDHEPVIPSCSSHCILVVHLDVIGKPLDENYVHRSQIVSEITGLSPGEILTPQSICSVINNPETYRNKIPPDTEMILFLNGVNSAVKRRWVEEIEAHIDPKIIRKVVWGDLFSR